MSQAEVRLFFESICGEVIFLQLRVYFFSSRGCQAMYAWSMSSSSIQVARLRLLGDYRHSTRIAFVEFVMVCTMYQKHIIYCIQQHNRKEIFMLKSELRTLIFIICWITLWHSISPIENSSFASNMSDADVVLYGQIHNVLVYMYS